MDDSQTTIRQLRDIVDEFVSQRDWHQFHAPKNLSMALAIEAAELMEHFQWIGVEQSRQLANDDAAAYAGVSDELSGCCVLCARPGQLNAIGSHHGGDPQNGKKSSKVSRLELVSPVTRRNASMRD